MRNKILGTLYGMALGDAMGMPSELLSRRRIRELFGEITTFLDSPPENPAAIGLKRGEFTDDTAQALVILDSLMENDFVPDRSVIARNLMRWAEDTDAFSKNILGQSSKAALIALQKGEDPEPYTVKAVTNGAAMRIAPIGCLFPSDQPEALASYVYRISEVTHKTDVTIAGAAMIAAAVSAAMEDRSWDAIMETALAVHDAAATYGAETYSASCKARLRLALERARQCRDDEEAFSRFVYEVIGTTTLMSEAAPAALAMAYYFRDPERCALACANLGGDTDTIGAMAVAVCGARAGSRGIRAELVQTMKESNRVDFDRYAESILLHRGKIVC